MCSVFDNELEDKIEAPTLKGGERKKSPDPKRLPRRRTEGEADEQRTNSTSVRRNNDDKRRNADNKKKIVEIARSNE